MIVAVYGDDVILCKEAKSFLVGLGVEVGETDVSGQSIPSIPHTVDAIRLLRNVGCELPTKMKTGGYDWPGRFTPYAHQIDTADFLAGYDKAFCLSSPGTGKTAAAIWAADFLIRSGHVRRVAVLCTLSCMESVWADEIFDLTPNHPCGVANGTKEAKQKILNSEYTFVVLNHDGVKTLESELTDPKNAFDLIIADECTAFKNGSSDRSKAFKRVLEGRKVWMLTGTPIPQVPTDAHFLATLVNPNAPKFITHFRDKTMVRRGPFKWVAKADAADSVYAILQPAIRFDKDDCLDMPETVTLKRKVELTPTQIGMLAELKKEWVFDVGEVAITAQNAAIRLGKLMQVCQGIAIDSDSEVHAVDALPRLQAMYDAVVESESKSIVFVPYVGALKQVSAYLTSRGITNEIVYGGVSGSKRTQVFNDFQTRKSPQVIVAHPRTTSHGLTLTAASTTVWYGPIFSAETFEQANNRTDRPGQKFNMRNIHLYATPEEKKVFDALESKISLQGVLLDMYRRIAPQ